MTEISPVSNFYAQTSSVNPPSVQKPAAPVTNPQSTARSFSTAEVSAAVLATALVATTIGGAVLHGKYKGLVKKTSELEKEISKALDGEKEAKAAKSALDASLDAAKKENQTLGVRVGDLETQLTGSEARASQLETENQTLGARVGDLETQLTGSEARGVQLEADKQHLQQINEQLEATIQELLDGKIPDDAEIITVLTQLRAKLANAKLGYDPQNPHIVRRTPRVFDDLVDLPAAAGTQNRANMTVLQVPEIKNGRFELEMPISDEVKVVKMPSRDFTPEHNVRTTLSENYADSLNWDNDKIARDILQNFYDGHGQTLDGVAFKIVQMPNGKYKVRIEGQSTYTPDKALLIGESTKRANANAAGNYGEGLKVATLKLLKEGGAKNVVYSSDNWRVNYTLQNGNFNDERVLTYSIDKLPEKYDGNFMEFETDSLDFVRSIRKSINHFYHSGNEHFKCPDFENDMFGIKFLPKGEKGGLYIAGQRFEYNGDYDGLENMVFFIKEKPPVKVLDPSRDRTSLKNSELCSIVAWAVKESNTITKEQRLQLIKVFEPHWTNCSYYTDDVGSVLRTILEKESGRGSDTLHIKFPDNCVADSWCDDSIKQTLENNGYKICQSGFSSLGMKTIGEVYGEARKHTPVQPNKIQEKRMIILREAIQKFSDSMKKLGFSDGEIDARIHLFDRTAPKERLHSNALAEAIVENGTSKGFWIDCNYIQENSFGHVLETALHELSHKVGGDSTAEFSYKLTDVNAALIEELMKNPQTRKEFQALSKLWNETA